LQELINGDGEHGGNPSSVKRLTPHDPLDQYIDSIAPEPSRPKIARSPPHQYNGPPSYYQKEFKMQIAKQQIISSTANLNLANKYDKVQPPQAQKKTYQHFQPEYFN